MGNRPIYGSYLERTIDNLPKGRDGGDGVMIIDPPYDPEFDGEDPPPDWPFSPEWQERRAYHRPPFEPVVGLWDESLSECDWYSYVVLP